MGTCLGMVGVLLLTRANNVDQQVRLQNSYSSRYPDNCCYLHMTCIVSAGHTGRRLLRIPYIGVLLWIHHHRRTPTQVAAYFPICHSCHRLCSIPAGSCSTHSRRSDHHWIRQHRPIWLGHRQSLFAKNTVLGYYTRHSGTHWFQCPAEMDATASYRISPHH